MTQPRTTNSGGTDIPVGPSPRVVVTGMGVLTAVGAGTVAFAESLRAGRSGIAPVSASRCAARLGEPTWPATFDALPDSLGRLRKSAPRILRSAPWSTPVAAVSALEAWLDANLAPVDPEGIALVVAGNNLHQRYTVDAHDRFLDTGRVNPRYAIGFPDTGTLGVISEILGIRGAGLTVGGSAAAGNLALHQALLLLRGGAADVCLCVGAPCDFSPLEFEAFTAAGAMSIHPDPARACRPFDADRNGFVYGQASAALVLETEAHARRRGARVRAELAAAAIVLDGNHSIDPNRDGEARAMTLAMRRAGVEPADVQYLNAHGTGSPAGDSAECAAVRKAFGDALPIVNSTKAITGHTFTAAGVVEAVATILQMEGGFAHADPFLEHPIDDRIPFVGRQSESARIEVAASNSFSFGGINSTVILRRRGEATA